VSECADAIHQSQYGLARRHGHILNGKVSLTISRIVLRFRKDEWDSFNNVWVRVRVIIDYVIRLQSAAITVVLRSISQSRENRRKVLIS